MACGAVCAAMVVFATAARAQDATDSVTQVQAESTYGGLWSAEACSRPSSPRLATAVFEAACGEHAPTSRGGEQRRQAAALHSSFAAADAAVDAPPSASSLPDAPLPQPANGGYEPITAKERLKWLAVKTFGIDDLAAGVVWAGYGTAVNKPREDGPHWGGFGERYGVRLAGVATSNVMEAGLGAMWGEDPRYKSARGKEFGSRVWSVIEQTFVTRRRDGHFAPAYARYMAVPGSNFLSNAWRPDSEADSYHAGIRTLEGFGAVLGSNAWGEFWPTVRDRMIHKH